MIEILVRRRLDLDARRRSFRRSQPSRATAHTKRTGAKAEAAAAAAGGRLSIFTSTTSSALPLFISIQARASHDQNGCFIVGGQTVSRLRLITSIGTINIGQTVLFCPFDAPLGIFLVVSR